MTSGTVTFSTNTLYPLTSSMLLDRPYLNHFKNNQKRKKPQYSKLSILTKASISSTKVTSNQYKKRRQSKNYKNIDKKILNNYTFDRDKKKNRSNSCKHRMAKTIKVERLGLSYQPQDFKCIQKQTPMSRTVYKKQQVNSISPLYSSLIFNSSQQHNSPEYIQKDLSKILERTFHVLSQYKQQCNYLKKQRDFYKKKCQKISVKNKKLQKFYFNFKS